MDPLRYHVIFDREIPHEFEPNITKLLKGSKKNARLLEEANDYNFSIVKIDDRIFEIQFKFKQTISNFPTYVLEFVSDDPNIKFTKTELPFILQDYYSVSEVERKKFVQAGAASKAGEDAAENLIGLNNIFSPGNAFALKGMVLIQTFQLLRFINISYPPNVLELFDKKLSTYMKDFDIPIQAEDGQMGAQYYKFKFSKYILNNTGSYMLGGWIFFFLGVLALKFMPTFKRIPKFKSILFFLCKLEETFVWNFFLNHFLSRFMILTYSSAANLRFYSTDSKLGRFDLFFAIISNIFIYSIPIVIFVKLREMRKLKFTKILPMDHSENSPSSSNSQQVQHGEKVAFQSSKYFNKAKPIVLSPKNGIARKRSLFLKDAFIQGDPFIEEEVFINMTSLNKLDIQVENLDSVEKDGLKTDQSINKNSLYRESLKVPDFLDLEFSKIIEKTPIEEKIDDGSLALIENNRKTPQRKSGSKTNSLPSNFTEVVVKENEDRMSRINNNKREDELKSNPEDLPITKNFSDFLETNKFLESSSTTQNNSEKLANNSPLEISTNPALENLKTRYKIIHEEFLDDQWIRSYFILIEIFRQVLISFIILIGDYQPFYVSLFIMLINGLFIILLIWTKPFKSFQTFILTLLTEIFLFIICLGILGLAFLQDYVNERNLTHDFPFYLRIGWMIVYTNIILIYSFLIVQSIGYFIIIFDFYRQIIPLLKKYIKDRKKLK